ncbi:DHA2 family efflux MFS transporter permease subunit [Propionimicrobium sp. PCR01-08-3]|uniref:DHA2 family efflux MFS transporter permease subunit n=1 Tax=Propionimicrobium sp. PCR01-08-3 TaxID=3052086 RepID=UPI00255CF6C0|nr:DHA2 family efflux MFS transporter permease subunit [Propionimicrobium sp. PCR01-08-3]WIY84149.1 DHA2 family efflux MFS transporter permease subunit [Propionimicrobium sp. PCR01-08-3]
MPSTVVRESSRTHRLRWWGLGVLTLGLFMASLDNTILNVALPTLARELRASTDQLQWTVDAYQVTYAGLLLVAGGLVDRWGRSRTFLVGTAVFGGFSLMAGLVGTTGLLIGARALMGVGAALLAPSTLSLVSLLFANAKERTMAFAVWSAANGAGGAVGPVLSGILLEHFGWGSIFLINVPVALCIVILGAVVLPRSRPHQIEGGIDYLGAILSTIALALICWSVISAPGLGAGNPLVLAAVLAGVGLLAAFIYWESRASAPLLKLSLFKIRTFTVAVSVAGLVTAAGAGALFVLTQYLQFVLDYTPMQTGVRVLPVAAAMLLGALAAPRFIAVLRLKRTVLIGLGCVGAGYALIATTSANSNFMHLLPGVLLFGLGAGLLVPAATQAVMDSLPPDATGAGSATNTALQQVGSALGVAVIGSLLAARYRGVLMADSLWPQLGDLQQTALESVAGAARAAEQLSAGLAAQLNALASQGFVAGMRVSMLICAVALLAALVAVAVLYPRDGRH